VIDPRRYNWDSKILRYRDSGTGRLISRKGIRDAMDTAISNSGMEVNHLSRGLQAGKISLAEWELGMRRQIKNVHLFNAAGAAGGWNQLDATDFARMGPVVRDQYKYLRRFHNDIKSGKTPLDGRFLRRADMYAQAGRRTYVAVDQQTHIMLGFNFEQNFLQSSDECEGCLAATKAGRVMIRTLPPIGTRDCLSNCKCRIDFFKDKDEASVPIGSGGGFEYQLMDPNKTITDDNFDFHNEALKEQKQVYQDMISAPKGQYTQEEIKAQAIWVNTKEIAIDDYIKKSSEGFFTAPAIGPAKDGVELSDLTVPKFLDGTHAKEMYKNNGIKLYGQSIPDLPMDILEHALEAMKQGKEAGLDMPDVFSIVRDVKDPQGWVAKATISTAKDEKVIVLNIGNDVWKDGMSSYHTYQKQAVASGFSASDHPYATFWHEMGHITKKGMDMTPAGPALHKYALESVGEVSKYAAVSKSEYISEVITLKLAGKKISDDVLMVYSGLGGPVINVKKVPTAVAAVPKPPTMVPSLPAGFSVMKEEVVYGKKAIIVKMPNGKLAKLDELGKPFNANNAKILKAQGFVAPKKGLIPNPSSAAAYVAPPLPTAAANVGVPLGTGVATGVPTVPVGFTVTETISISGQPLYVVRTPTGKLARVTAAGRPYKASDTKILQGEGFLAQAQVKTKVEKRALDAMNKFDQALFDDFKGMMEGNNSKADDAVWDNFFREKEDYMYRRLEEMGLSKDEIAERLEMYQQVMIDWIDSSDNDGALLMKFASRQLNGSEIIFHEDYLDHDKDLHKRLQSRLEDVLSDGYYFTKVEDLAEMMQMEIDWNTAAWTKAFGSPDATVKVFRGMKDGGVLAQGLGIKRHGEIGFMNAPGNAASSWTTAQGTASSFGRNVFVQEISPKDILFSHASEMGLRYSYEKEQILNGLPRRTAYFNISDFEHDLSAGDVNRWRDVARLAGGQFYLKWAEAMALRGFRI